MGRGARSAGTTNQVESGQAQVCLRLLPGNRSSRLTEGLLCCLVVEAILECAQEFKIRERYEHRDVFAAAVEHDTFSTIGHAVEGVRELGANLGGGKPCHRPSLRYNTCSTLFGCRLSIVAPVTPRLGGSLTPRPCCRRAISGNPSASS